MAEEQTAVRIEAAPEQQADRALVAAAPAPAPAGVPSAAALPGRAEGVSILAVYHYILGGLFVLLALVFSLPAVITTIIGIFEDPGALVATGILALLAFITLLMALVFLAVGWGLWKERDWARIGAIVLAGLGLLFVPIGTIIGGVTIWYLLQPQVVAKFR